MPCHARLLIHSFHMWDEGKYIQVMNYSLSTYQHLMRHSFVQVCGLGVQVVSFLWFWKILSIGLGRYNRPKAVWNKFMQANDIEAWDVPGIANKVLQLGPNLVDTHKSCAETNALRGYTSGYKGTCQGKKAALRIQMRYGFVLLCWERHDSAFQNRVASLQQGG